MNTISRFSPVAAAALFLVIFAEGCFNPFSPPLAPQRGISAPPPVPNTPTNLLRLFEWCYNQRAIVEYREIFTEDFRFSFSVLDEDGEPYKGDLWTRDDELISATQLFQGGSAEEPPASSIELSLARTFYVYPDTRRGKNGKWHKYTRTTVLLQIRTAAGDPIDIQGAATFYLVRGDSAQIPEDLKLLGFEPDSNRWYIERWEDDTARPDQGGQALGASVHPSEAPFRAGGATPRARSVTLESGVHTPRTSPSGRDGLLMQAIADPLPQVASWGAVKAYYRNR